MKTQPIDARESKLILEALAKADWTKDRADFRLTPAQLFAQLGATAQHGRDPPNFRTSQERETAAKRWLSDNAETFRIEAFAR
jgi:hypothetical protein